MPLSRKNIRSRREFLLKIVIAAALIGAVIALLQWFFYGRDWVTTDNAYVAGNIIPVQADATGVVAAVLAEETQFVKKDATLVRLDGQRARAVLAHAEAELGRAVRAVGALYAQRRQVCQKVISRAAIRDKTRHDLARYRQAAASGASSRQVLQNAEDQLAAQEADLREAQAEYQAVEARVGGVTRMNHPDIEAAKARYNEAYIEFARQNIRAPASGYVAKRRVQVGERVRPGDAILDIVPLDHLWVEANLWENRMARVRPGQPAIITVDLYGSKQIYHGEVVGLVPGSGAVFATLPPDNAVGNFIRIVQRIPVRIALRTDELEKQPLRPGLSTVASIDVSGPLESPNHSIVKTTANEYLTNVYDKDLADAKARADKIVKDNIAGASDDGAPCGAAE
ncbi:efflux RND transporter periplasmic adaptor subunit [Methylocystis sp.]|uniref:efflux RND transporter periplasmic adaptor subunit n=1 Tax=Methylocystis sp. TaxID=1911079 RepID=UPI003D0CF64C